MFPVVIPVAGLGTRSLPASKVVPKELLPLYDKPIIQYIVEEAVEAQTKDLVLVSSRGKHLIEDHFDIQPELEHALEKKGKTELLETVKKVSRMVDVYMVRQKEALGLGHAVWCAKNFVQDSHYFVMLGDEVTDAKPNSLQQMLQVFENLPPDKKNNAGVLMLMEVPPQDVSKYGIAETSGKDLEPIHSCIEKPPLDKAPSNWAITGRYLLPKKSFQYIEEQSEGALGEIQLTDALNRLAKEGHLYPCFFKGKRLDAGDRLGFLEANLHYYLKSPHCQQVKELLKKLKEEL